jgi:hypothetical protein
VEEILRNSFARAIMILAEETLDFELRGHPTYIENAKIKAKNCSF